MSRLVGLLALSLAVASVPVASFAAPSKKKATTKTSKKATPSKKKTKGSATTVLFAPNGSVPVIENDIAAKLGAAKTSIDIAMYTFESATLSDAVIAAHKRGVACRVLLDSAEAKTSLSKDVALKQAGVPVDYIQVTGGPMGNKFHHKFCIIDGTSLIFGSYNWTESADADNYENCLTIHDSKIVQPFVTEFQSLWTSKTGGVASTDNVAFAPTGSAHGLETLISDEIARAKSEIVIAMYEFTSQRVADAVVGAAQRGVKVSIVTDGNEASVNKATLAQLTNAGVEAKTITLKGSGWTVPEFHDKYCVIDGKVVVTGSFNWNVNQDAKGYEDVVVLADSALAKKYVTDFASIWGTAK
jgi:phosphatidylserine/phosphatidylglycerophosphate/cardiolipin synthase-like enzyme